ncbi:hypothetical protein HanHA89_Chr08g0303741 [Helianthus annuus]|nr:hypothetical protein HanHA89_Chr08g0303741 [Helianthus annuus]
MLVEKFQLYIQFTNNSFLYLNYQMAVFFFVSIMDFRCSYILIGVDYFHKLM